ncbi:MAG: hypothetical protein IKO42_07100 [Opitutales bacterium]|nr:hypothetical protein [Opitutales bacterium]
MKHCIKKITFAFALLSFAALFAASEKDKCIYCGSTSYGQCSKSPFKVHEHIGDSGHCVYCGSSSYGQCTKSPTQTHKHGHGENKCVYCGSTSYGQCTKSPAKVHVK